MVYCFYIIIQKTLDFSWVYWHSNPQLIDQSQRAHWFGYYINVLENQSESRKSPGNLCLKKGYEPCKKNHLGPRVRVLPNQLLGSVVLPIDHFTVVCSVAWPLDGSEAGDLVLIPTSLACENSRPSSLPARVTFRVKDVCDSPPKIPYW